MQMGCRVHMHIIHLVHKAILTGSTVILMLVLIPVVAYIPIQCWFSPLRTSALPKVHVMCKTTASNFSSVLKCILPSTIFAYMKGGRFEKHNAWLKKCFFNTLAFIFMFFPHDTHQVS
jgi:hypothetical protein